MAFEQFLQLIQRGESVSPGVTNRPLRTLDQNVRYLWELIQAAAIGATVHARQVTVEAAALVGMPVYYNTTTQRFERALARAEVDLDSGAVLVASSAQVWGVVSFKHNSTLADLLLFGYDELDIDAAVDGDIAAGNYYLSGSLPGKLIQQRPPVSVPVLRHDGNGRVFVMPQFADFLDRHTHYRFALTCVPAGKHTPPAPSNRHEITDPDADRAGWLPADHANFQGKAPDGAAFGYNLQAHPELLAVWPPLPPGNAYLELDRGEDATLAGQGVPLGTTGQAIVDVNGIWWMSDCYGDVPWPTDYDSDAPVSYSDSADVECPRHLQMALTIWFSRPNFATELTVVTSLRSNDDRLQVVCLQNGDAASIGDLLLKLDLALTVTDMTTRGAVALKTLGSDGKILAGPVCEGLYAASDNVTLTSDLDTIKLDPDDEDSANVHQGMIGVAVSTEATRELSIQLVRLDGVTEEFLDDTTYLGFANGQQSSFRAKLYIPADLVIPDPQITLRFIILGRAAGALPTLTLTGRRVPRPTDGLSTPMDLPDDTDEFTVAITTTATLTAGNQYVEAVSDPFEVAAGDIVFFTLERAASDGYAAQLGILSQTAEVSEAA